MSFNNLVSSGCFYNKSGLDNSSQISRSSKDWLDRNSKRQEAYELSHILESNSLPECALTAKKIQYQNCLYEVLFNTSNHPHSILNPPKPRPLMSLEKQLKIQQTVSEKPCYVRNWKIDGRAFKNLDLPGFVNDFYSFPLDWSKKNIIGIVMRNAIYTFNDRNGRADLFYVGEDRAFFPSIKWNPLGLSLMTGEYSRSNEGKTFTLSEVDLETKKSLFKESIEIDYTKQFPLHWSETNRSLFGAECKFYSLDNRSPANNLLNEFEDTALSIEKVNSSYLTAIGFDESVALIDLRRPQTLVAQIPHKTSIKAVKWHPDGKAILATGGGRGDGEITLYDCAGFPKKICNLVSKGNFGVNQSQVCDIAWPEDQVMMVSYGWGGCENPRLSFWDLYTRKEHHFADILEVRGENTPPRAIALATNPGKTKIVYASTHNALSFLKLPEEVRKTKKIAPSQSSKLSYYDIR